MESGIYEIINRITNKVYIGSAVDMSVRWRQHLYGLSKGIHHSKHLQLSWNKYKEQNYKFEIIEYCSIDKLIEREQFYLDCYKSYNPKYGYNICSIAGSVLGIKFSDESKEKLSKSQKGHNVSEKTREKLRMINLGNHHSEKTKEKLSKINKGKICSKETKEKISELTKGINNPFYGKYHSEETKKKMRESQRKRRVIE